MDGKNSSGRRISLLNDSAEPQLPARLPSIPPSLRSRTSSYTSSPVASPATPQLVRSDSTDSAATMQTPSPITPEFGFDGLPPQSLNSPVFNQASFFPTQKELVSAYPPLSQNTGPLPYPANNLQQNYYRPPPSTESHNGAASANPRSKKNSYPCPVAKQYNCGDHFTTSGHAARHAKKHTGKKDAFCPECNKAFTRKDNMEQHRRTHQNGRGASRTSGSSDDSKIKKSTKPAPKKPTKVEPALEAAVEQQLAEQQLEQQQQQQQSQPQPQMPMMQAQMQPPPQTLQQAQAQHPNTDPAILIPPVGGPYFLNSVDSGPIHSLPMPSVNETAVRPTLQRNSYGQNSLDYFPPPAQMLGELDTLNFSYPSPGLSNGLNSLALAASEHRRLSDEKSAKSPSSDGPTP